MNMTRSTLFKWAAAGAVAAGTLFAAASANAGNVAWSVGVNVPGVAIGVATPQPYYVAPAPVYYPAPAYVAPPAYYGPAPVYYAPPPVYYRPAPGYYHRHYRGPYYRY
jgi:hypothetical protein